MSTKNILFAIFSLFTFSISAQGLLLSTEEELSGVEQYIEEDRGYTSYLPNYYSLEKYAPPIMSQFQTSSCVGWAMCYSAYSIQHNIHRKITSVFEKKMFSFDPYYMYSIMKNKYKNEECSKGLFMTEAMDFLMEMGAKRIWMTPFIACDNKWSSEWIEEILFQSSSFAIDDYNKVDPEDLSLIKKLIYDGHPVIIGANINDSFDDVKSSKKGTINSNGVWNPNYADIESISGHAMTIVAYNDYKFGGAFKVMNSWGEDWGNKGYVWIKYEDFAIIVDEAFIIFKDFDSISETPYFTYFKFNDGDIYEGNVDRENDFQGYGYYQWANGNTYMGEWSNHNRDGEGIYFDYGNRVAYYCKYEDDVRIHFESLGFADDDVKSDIELYFEKFNFGFKFKDADPSTVIPDIE